MVVVVVAGDGCCVVCKGLGNSPPWWKNRNGKPEQSDHRTHHQRWEDAKMILPHHFLTLSNSKGKRDHLLSGFFDPTRAAPSTNYTARPLIHTVKREKKSPSASNYIIFLSFSVHDPWQGGYCGLSESGSPCPHRLRPHSTGWRTLPPGKQLLSRSSGSNRWILPHSPFQQPSRGRQGER